MDTSTTIAIITIGLLVFIAHGLEDVFARTKIPDVLILLFIGLLLGPVTGLTTPESFGKAGPVFTTLILIVILFEGGLGLDLKVLGKSLVGATGLTVWNFVLTMAVVAPITKVFLGFNWLQACTLAATVGGTSSAVVIPVLKRLKLGEKAKTVLMLESALSDVLVIVVTLALVGAQTGNDFRIGRIFGEMFNSFLIAAVIGALTGVFWSLTLHWLHGLKNSIFTTPAFVLVVYGLTEWLGFSGAIAALMMGITIGNIKELPPYFLKKRRELLTSPSETELAVFGEVAFLLKTFFFVYVGISIQMSDSFLVVAGLGTTLALFILRVPVVHASLIPSASFSRFDASVSGAMNTKGLAAAVAASIPFQRGLDMGEEIKQVAFAIVLFTILAASLLVFLIEHGWFNVLGNVLYRRYKIEATPEATLEPNYTDISNNW
jgi:NhaP-type Na+/H+ or K+/H+ antiporter